MEISQSSKLAGVCYDIRGPVLAHARHLEQQGHRVLKLNTGNPAAFGLFAPDELLVDVVRHLPDAQGYGDSKGLVPPAKRSSGTTPARASKAPTSTTSTSATASPS